MINVITTFSGYDSQCLALRKAGIEFNLVAWAEFDPQSKQPLEKQPAVIAHNLLFPEYKDRNLGDMAKADWQRFKGIDIDLFTYSFPCTDISQAGLMKGLSKDSGTRSSCLWYCEAAISTLRPKYLLMENVKNLVSKKFMPDFMQWYDVLQELGYTNYWKVMNAKDYGVPQNRERVFMVSIRNDLDRNSFTFPSPWELKMALADVLEEDADESFFLKDAMVEKFLRNNEKEGEEFIYKTTDRKFTEDELQEILANG